MNVIELEHLTHRYDSHTALSDVTLSVPEGAIYALLGPNGAGKSTLLHILMGLRRQTSGTVRLLGKERTTLTIEDRAAISYIAEGQKLPDWMTLAELEAYLAPIYPAWDFTLASELRDRFRLSSHRKLKTFSRGEHMKAALLCALAPRPRLLLMDEPFTGIDVAAKDDIVRAMLLSAGEGGWTVVISSHDIAELEMMVDWVGFLDRGRLITSQSLDSLREEHRALVDQPSLREIFISLTEAGIHRAEVFAK